MSPETITLGIIVVQKMMWYLQRCMCSLKGQVEEERFLRVVAPQDLLHSGWTEGTFLRDAHVCMNLFECIPCLPVYVKHCGVVADHLPGRPVSIVQVKSTGFGPITALIGEVVSTASQCTQETLKATPCWEAAGPAEAQVPFTHHVGGVSSLNQTLW